MKKSKAKPRIDAEETKPDPQPRGRGDDLTDEPGVKDGLLDLYQDIEKGFENQNDRANQMMDFWDIYNCKLSGNQFYTGNSKIFLPVTRDAIEARVTRFTNQIFPVAGRYIEVTTEDGTIPQAEMSLAEHYIRRAKLRTVVVPALIRNGDVEGQYSVYVSWIKRTRHVAWRTQKPLEADEGVEDPEEKVDDIETEEISDARPHVEVLADTDLLILPATADTVDDALAGGGSVTVLRRWSKYKIKKMIEDKEILEEEGEHLLEEMKTETAAKIADKPKAMTDAAGIKLQGGSKHALVYETWTQLTIDGERRLCKVFFGSEKAVLSAKRNPNWSDRCPIFSVPVKKVQGAVKGQSLLRFVDTVQYFINDTINQAADSASFSMMPIVMTDPEKNPRIGTMVLNLAAVWETSPNDTQFAKFPDIWKSGFEIVNAGKAQISQTLSVSPASMTQSSQQKAKPSQADTAREQQVDILTTADAVTIVEEGILTPVTGFIIELDHQHRNEKILVRQFGEKGIRAKMDWVPPIQMDRRYSYRWFGVEQARNQQQMQQQIAGLNVIRGIPPEQYPGYRINLVPIMTNLMENLFGPRLAPLVFEDVKAQLTIQAQQENELMADGFDIPIHPMDDDQEHLKAHQQLMQQGDPQGVVRAHMQKHMMQMKIKQQAQMQQSVAQMMQGPQGGGGGGGGQGGGRSPRQGAQPGAQRGGQGPPGMVGRDRVTAMSGQPPALRQRG